MILLMMHDDFYYMEKWIRYIIDIRCITVKLFMWRNVVIRMSFDIVATVPLFLYGEMYSSE